MRDDGLVYHIEVEGARVRIAMAMTSPACPLADYLKELVTSAIHRAVPDGVDLTIELVSEPHGHRSCPLTQVRRRDVQR